MMKNKTITWETIPVDGTHILDLKIDTENYIVTAWISSCNNSKEPPLLFYNEKFENPVDYVSVAINECYNSGIIAYYNSIVSNNEGE